MQYTTSDVAQLLGLSPQQIRLFVRSGFIRPFHGARGAFLFSFQDLILLRTAAALRHANISMSRTLRALRSLRRQLPAGRSLTELRITTDGTRVVVHDGSVSWQPDSGQTIIDFDVADMAAKAQPIAKQRFRVDRDFRANEWFEAGLELEVVAPLEAQQAYGRALALDPKHADAHVNLGRLLHEEGHTVEAATHYLQALRYDGGHATAAFNLGVAMEDLGRVSEAIKAYQQCIAADPAFADAHYNLAAVLEKLGDERGAIRHLTKYRRLGGTSGP